MALLAAQSLGAFPPGIGQWLVIDRALAAGLLLALFWPCYSELRGAPWLGAHEIAWAIGAGIAVFAAWIALDAGWARFGAATGGFRPLASDGRIDWPLAFLRLMGLAAIVPLMEELFWRSFLMRWIDTRAFLTLDARRVSRAAFALSSALFAAEHSLWVAGLIAGLAYAALYIRTNNLWAPVLAHTVTNAILGVWILATGKWHLW